MDSLVKHTDLKARDELIITGQEISSLVTSDYKEADLDNSTCLIETKATYGQWTRETTVSLKTEAMLGFGAMLGIADDLEQLFPYGTNFQVRVYEDGSTNTSIGTDNNDDPVFVLGLASCLAGREQEGLWVLTLEAYPEILNSSALPSIQNPDTLLAAADFTLRVAQRAISNG